MEVFVQRDNAVVISERDVKIVQDYSHGKSMNDISVGLGLSKRSVEAIFNKLRAKFDCKNVVHLVATLMRNGTIK
jgi:DNA-binding CsgD family transcriptional regulator